MSAGEELVRLLEELEQAGTSVMDLVRGGRPPEPWRLYPGESGIFDRRTRYQFYYHAHAGAEHEDGHFHTARLFDDHTAHLVAISMASTGWPQALFTLNLWAIGDAYEAPETLKRYARDFRIRERRGPARLVRFVNLVFQRFRPEIEWLQDEKERTLQAYRATHPGRDPFTDRSLEILSRVEIDVRQRGQRLLSTAESPAGR
ncbi:MAG: hypothetical protein HY002_19340 [Candidatus Rokubacteria bacterium]|nr:hypothetical protein [Candidatus Rokubacteria bacterium]